MAPKIVTDVSFLMGVAHPACFNVQNVYVFIWPNCAKQSVYDSD